MSSSLGAPQVVTFGEVLLRLSPPGNERLFQSPSLRTWWGGAEANVAAGLAWLGTPSRHVTVLPDGALGDAAVRTLRADGVDTSHVRRTPGRLGLYFLESGADVRALTVAYDRADSAFARMAGDAFDWDAILDGARWLHLSGVSVALGDGPYRAVRAAADAAVKRGVRVSLDLNHRPALWQGRDARPFMEPLAAQASLLIGNPGAMDIMLGQKTAGTMPEPSEAIADSAAALHTRFGCAHIAVTQRDIISASVHGWQAHLFDAATGTLHSAPSTRVTLTDRVGGGDAFAAALLHELLRYDVSGGAPSPDALHAAVRFATAASALKLTIPGDVNRVTRADVERLLAATL